MKESVSSAILQEISKKISSKIAKYQKIIDQRHSMIGHDSNCELLISKIDTLQEFQEYVDHLKQKYNL